MRDGYENGILKIDDSVVGVNLGSDFCAEHEWGIKKICNAFGINREGIGLEKKLATKIHPNLKWYEKTTGKGKKKVTIAGFAFFRSYVGSEQHYIDSWLSPSYMLDQKTHLRTGWDEESFGVFSSDLETTKVLKEIFEAITKQDLAIWVGGAGVFTNGGLCICIASKIPEQYIKAWEEHDKEVIQIQKEMDETGIEEKLKSAGKGYYALRPQRDQDGSLIFWLNPMEQKTYNFGWYKLKDLEDWAENKGPITMNK